VSSNHIAAVVDLLMIHRLGRLRDRAIEASNTVRAGSLSSPAPSRSGTPSISTVPLMPCAAAAK